jgi:predicted RNA-binding protein
MTKEDVFAEDVFEEGMGVLGQFQKIELDL